MASEAVGPGSIPGGTTSLKMQKKAYKIRYFFRSRGLPTSNHMLSWKEIRARCAAVAEHWHKASDEDDGARSFWDHLFT
jgi:hypothetical protein